MSDQDRQHEVDDRLESYFKPEVSEQTQQPTEDAQPQEPMPSSDNTDVNNDEKEALDNSKNPERTKAYIDKLKGEIEQLKSSSVSDQNVDTQDFGTSVFDAFHPKPVEVPQSPTPSAPTVQTPYLNPQQVQNIKGQFVDAEGNVDIEGLNRALIGANQQAYDATQRVQSLEQKLQKIEENDQVREAHAQHPEIDPSKKETFDKKLFELVRDRLLRNMYEGKQQRLADVVSEVKGMFPQVNVTQVKQEAVDKYKATQQARNQGPFETGSANRLPQNDLDDLRKATRKGGQTGDIALAQRLKALGI